MNRADGLNHRKMSYHPDFRRSQPPLAAASSVYAVHVPGGTGSGWVKGLGKSTRRSFQFPIMANQIVRRTVMLEFGRIPAFQFGNDALRQRFAQLDAPLVE